MRADFVFENYLLGESVEDIVEQFVGLDQDDVEKVISYAVNKLIEDRILEDNLRSEHAVGAAQAA